MATVIVQLIVGLALLVFGLPLGDWRRTLSDRSGWSKAASWFFPMLLCLLIPARALAGGKTVVSTTHPPNELLDELRKRLLEKPECAPACAEAQRLTLEARGRTLTLRLEVHSLAETAVPLPGGSKQWVPSSVLLAYGGSSGLSATNRA